MENNQLSEAFERVTIVQLAHELGYHQIREGAGQRSPFRDDKRAGSFSVQKSFFKDHANDEHSGGHIPFVQLARPGWPKKECIEFIIRAAGMEPERQSAGAMKRVAKEKREKLFSRAQDAVAEIPKLGMDVPPSMSDRVRERWNDGQAAMADYFAKLAESRGWDERVLRTLVGMNKTSLPALPWSEKHRGWAWLVEKPIFEGNRAALVPVGFHSRYKIFKKDEPTEKRWCYVPYIPTTDRPSAFQKILQHQKVRLPAYPFVLGDLAAPRLVVILEGQFDAVSFAEAFGWLGRETAGGKGTEAGGLEPQASSLQPPASIPPGIVIFGLRGVSSPNVFMAAYGGWLRKHKPFVWIFPDNDEAGKGLIRRKNPERIDAQPCFLDRIRAQGCKTVAQFLPLDGCKDFNDIWRAEKPPVFTMRALASVAGCGDLIKGDEADG